MSSIELTDRELIEEFAALIYTRVGGGAFYETSLHRPSWQRLATECAEPFLARLEAARAEVAHLTEFGVDLAVYEQVVARAEAAEERERSLAAAVADTVWKATQYGTTEDGDTFAYIVPKGTMHRLVGVAQSNGAHVPVAFRAASPTPTGPAPATHPDDLLAAVRVASTPWVAERKFCPTCGNLHATADHAQCAANEAKGLHPDGIEEHNCVPEGCSECRPATPEPTEETP